MARTDVPVKRVSRLAASYFTAAEAVNGDTVNGMRMSNNGATVLVISNSAGVSRTIDTILVETVDFQPAGPVTITIGASAAFAVVGPFPTELYGNVLEFDVSNASLDFGAFSLL